eukprot:TRINITY_DN64382_c0_g1_i1.p1 TRINITY_DN64382_c0_g1~~TRINITY_DN64382_c0_g1_i1.p1  ORF type:complete len:282 (+),score=42.00 TRINITY_DN64382_c0_g1_i1:96-941(+)
MARIGADASQQTATGSAQAYFAGSFVATLFCFPLWKAAAVCQSGWVVSSGRTSFWRAYLEAARPPWIGCLNVVVGITCSRAAIFYGSDECRKRILVAGYNGYFVHTFPPLLISAAAQIVNQPFVRASITLQDPKSMGYQRAWMPTMAVVQDLYQKQGSQALFLGTLAGLMKTVPKYVVAVTVKQWLEDRLRPRAGPTSRSSRLLRSGAKSFVAGVAGGVVTNPADVLRNEMFKTNQGMSFTFWRLCKEDGLRWCKRGWVQNVMSVTIPVGLTIFLTDVFSR